MQPLLQKIINMAIVQGLTGFLSYAIVSAVLGMFQFGYNTGVINSPEHNIEMFINETYFNRNNESMEKDVTVRLFSVIVALFAVGGMIGGFLGGILADKIGRKKGIIINCVFGVLGGFCLATAKIFKVYELLFIGRFIIGLNCGLYTSLVPLYVSEIAPLKLRGGLGTVNQLGTTLGILFSQVFGAENILGNDTYWPVLLGITMIPPILQASMLPICPESPRYLLLTKGKEYEARTALIKLRATDAIEDDIQEMRDEEEAEKSEEKVTIKQLILNKSLRTPLIIGVVLQLSQQFSGINAVFYYSTSIFLDSGLSQESAKGATIGIGVIMVVMTIVTIPLMDRAGRRTLHLSGLGGMFVFSIILTISFLLKDAVDGMSYVSVVATLLYVTSFAIGPGSIPWMITAELFSQGPRPAAISITVLVNWSANFIVGLAFPSMKAALDDFTFVPFTVLLAIFWLFTYKRVPETKNKTFEEISALFKDKGTPQGRMEKGEGGHGS